MIPAFQEDRLLSYMTAIILAFMTVTAFASCACADEIVVSNFATEGLAGWESKSFKGTTDYRLVKEEGRAVVKASSNNSASGLIRKIRFMPSSIDICAGVGKFLIPLREETRERRQVMIMLPGFISFSLVAFFGR